MRKNYFAKKFVAYSMAFAVAFSTLTVSPVFIKEAKAAVVNVTDLSGASATFDDGVILLSSLDSNIAGVGTTTDVNTLKNDLQTGSKVISKFTVKKLNEVVAGTTTSQYQICTATPAVVDNPETADVDETRPANMYGLPISAQGDNYGTAILIDGKQNKDQKLTGTTDAGTWYKLKEYKDSYSVTTGASTAKVSYSYFEANKLGSGKKIGNGNTYDYDFNGATELTSSDMGLYIYVVNNAVVMFYNLAEKSDLNVTERKENTLVKLGSTAKLSVVATLSNKKALTYTWTKDGVDLKNDSDTLTVENVTKEKLGTYKCTVNDGIKSVSVYPRLSLVTSADVKNVKAASHTIATNVNVLDSNNKLPSGKTTLTTSIPEGDYKYIWTYGNGTQITLSQNDTVNYNPANKSITLENDGILNNTSVICYALPTSVYDFVFAKQLEDIKNNGVDDVSKYKANDALRKEEVESQDFDCSGTADNNSKIATAAKVVYTETFSFGQTGSYVTSEVKNVKLGESVKLAGPTKMTTPGTGKSYQYQWTLSNGTTKVTTEQDLTIDTVDVNDFGKIVCRVVQCKQTHKKGVNEDADCYTEDNLTTRPHQYDAGVTSNVLATTTYNMVYASDLTATGTDISAKAGQKDVKISVSADSSLPITYTWNTKTYAGTAWGALELIADAKNEASYTFTSATGLDKDTDFYNGEKADSRVHVCVVSDGIKTIEVPVKISEIDTFKVYENKAQLDDGNEISPTHYPNGINLVGLKDETIKLAPIVKAASDDIEKELKYQWKKDGIDFSTEKSISVAFDKATTYTLVVTEGTNKVEVTYNLNVIKPETLKANVNSVAVDVEDSMIYTGKEVNPVNGVTVSANFITTNAATNETYALKEGVDYKVTLVDAINAGVSLYNIELIGDFADFYNTLSENDKKQGIGGYGLKGTFTITRADNKVEIADNTVVLGKSVQPKTVTNLGKGALTYTYYADSDATTEIAAPTKVGTYYVKATANATINYNEAESNVAKVVVVPGKVKMLSTSRTASSVKLNWTKAIGATSYRVYYKAPGAKSYKVFKNTTATSMNVTGLASATTYTFAVKAYAKTAGYSTVYATKITTTAPAKVATPSVTAGSKKATVKFTKVARATGYQIYMAKGNGKYVKVKTTTSTSFTKTKLAKGATYKFKVRAYKTVGSNTYYGAFSSAKAVKVK